MVRAACRLCPGGFTHPPCPVPGSAIIGFRGVPAIKSRINPANWMLEVTSPEAEKRTGQDFAQLYARSELAAAAVAMVDKHRCGCLPVVQSTPSCLLYCSYLQPRHPWPLWAADSEPCGTGFDGRCQWACS